MLYVAPFQKKPAQDRVQHPSLLGRKWSHPQRMLAQRLSPLLPLPRPVLGWETSKPIFCPISHNFFQFPSSLSWFPSHCRDKESTDRNQAGEERVCSLILPHRSLSMRVVRTGMKQRKAASGLLPLGCSATLSKPGPPA